LAKSIPWAAILREKHVWAIVIAHVCNNFGGYIELLWLPTYLHKTFAVPMERLGSYSIAPWIAAFCVGNLSGWIADVLRKRGMSATAIRKLLQGTAFALGAVPMLLLPSAGSALVAITLVTIALGGVAPRPWRAVRAEAVLRGAPATGEVFGRAAEAELAEAQPLPGNAFKVPLARSVLVRTLLDLTEEEV